MKLKLIDAQGDELQVDEGTEERPVLISCIHRNYREDELEMGQVLLTRAQAIELILHLTEMISEKG